LIDVVTIYVHFNYLSLDFDFAVMQLAKISDFPDGIIEFTTFTNVNDTITDGEATFVSGWGDTRSTFENPQYLRAVEVPIVSMEIMLLFL
jgi:hypothetical protein